MKNELTLASAWHSSSYGAKHKSYKKRKRGKESTPSACCTVSSKQSSITLALSREGPWACALFDNAVVRSFFCTGPNTSTCFTDRTLAWMCMITQYAWLHVQQTVCTCSYVYKYVELAVHLSRLSYCPHTLWSGSWLGDCPCSCFCIWQGVGKWPDNALNFEAMAVNMSRRIHCSYESLMLVMTVVSVTYLCAELDKTREVSYAPSKHIVCVW